MLSCAGGVRCSSAVALAIQLALTACAPSSGEGSPERSSLRGVEQELEDGLGIRHVRVIWATNLRRDNDTLFVRVEGGKDLLGRRPGRKPEVQGPAVAIARRAARAAGPILDECSVVTIEFLHARRLGVLAWSAGRTRASFAVADLLNDEAAPRPRCENRAAV